MGQRIAISTTRRLVQAALSGELLEVPRRPDATFGFEVPAFIRGIDVDLLTPRATWADTAAFDSRAKNLAEQFDEQVARLSASVVQARKELLPAT